MALNTMQQAGLMQNQPTVKPPTPMANRTIQNIGGGGGMSSGHPEISDADNFRRPNGSGGFVDSNGIQVPQVTVAPPPTPPPAAPPTPGNAPAPGMDYLSGVRSRVNRETDRGVSAAEAAMKKRGLNTSGIGAGLVNNVRADLIQRGDETVNDQAFKEYQLKQQIAHETNMQNLIGSQKSDQIRLTTDEQLRGEKGMIPITREGYNSGVDAYREKFPGQAGGPGGAGLPPGVQRIEASGAEPGLTPQQMVERANAQSWNDYLTRNAGGGPSPNLPQVGPGSFSDPLSAKPSNDPNFGQPGLLNRPSAPRFTPGPSSPITQGPSSAGVQPTPAYRTPDAVPGQTYTPINSAGLPTGPIMPGGQPRGPSYQPTGGSYQPPPRGGTITGIPGLLS